MGAGHCHFLHLLPLLEQLVPKHGTVIVDFHVEADRQTFIARYNRPVSVFIIMRNQCGGQLLRLLGSAINI